MNIAIGSMHLLTFAAPPSVSAACNFPFANEPERMRFKTKGDAPATQSW